MPLNDDDELEFDLTPTELLGNELLAEMDRLAEYVPIEYEPGEIFEAMLNDPDMELPVEAEIEDERPDNDNEQDFLPFDHGFGNQEHVNFHEHWDDDLLALHLLEIGEPPDQEYQQVLPANFEEEQRPFIAAEQQAIEFWEFEWWYIRRDEVWEWVDVEFWYRYCTTEGVDRNGDRGHGQHER